MKIAFRVDGSAQIGSGHVMRCLTLAEQLAAIGCEIIFVCRHITDTMRALMTAKGFALAMLPPDAASEGDLARSKWLGVSQDVDAAATIAALGHAKHDWIIVDHYALDLQWERLLAPFVGKILAIDDVADRSHDCDILLDQNLQAGDRYAGLIPKRARKLIGPRYAVLRLEFRTAAGYCPPEAPPFRINVFFGGTDPKGMTLIALDGLQSVPDIMVDVIVGEDNPHCDRIAAVCSVMAGATLHVQPNDVAKLLASANLALGAGGTTSWERCCLGLPTLIVSVADNQRGGTEALAKAGAAIDLGSMEAVSPAAIAQAVHDLLARPERLTAMRSAARALVDGLGAERVASCIMCEHLMLRPATSQDREMAWRWRNHSAVRAHSFDTAPLPRLRHAEWWTAALAREDRILLVAHIGGQNTGVLRFDTSGHRATVSIYVDPDLAGLGLGRRILLAGANWLRENRPALRTVLAHIRPENTPSLKSFAAAGYDFDTGMDAWHLSLYPPCTEVDHENQG